MRWLKCEVFDSFAVAIANAGGAEAINNSFFHRFICMHHVLSDPSKVVIFFGLAQIDLIWLL
jgi:hypothetical protein